MFKFLYYTYLYTFQHAAVNQKSTFLNVTLKDVNDNAPIMPDSKQYKLEFSEADEVVKVMKIIRKHFLMCFKNFLEYSINDRFYSPG